MLFVYACARCEEQGTGHSYRVISEDDGKRLLDMTVCYGCYMEAAQLGLDTEKIEIHQVTLHGLLAYRAGSQRNGGIADLTNLCSTRRTPA